MEEKIRFLVIEGERELTEQEINIMTKGNVFDVFLRTGNLSYLLKKIFFRLQGKTYFECDQNRKLLNFDNVIVKIVYNSQTYFFDGTCATEVYGGFRDIVVRDQYCVQGNVKDKIVFRCRSQYWFIFHPNFANSINSSLCYPKPISQEHR